MTTTPADVAVAPGGPGSNRTLFGHPLGLYVLFFTELWERFSFYGMKALLILYMVNHFVWSQKDASFVLGVYAFSVYALPVVGGLAADKWLGAKRAVIVGGVLLAIGHFLMIFEPLPYFYTALALIATGVGFLKPNVATQVGDLYSAEDHRRDAAFTIYYMGINVGGFLGPIICGWLRIEYGFHYGFAAAGVGMVLGLIFYIAGHRKLVARAQHSNNADPSEQVSEKHPPHVVRDRVIVLLVIFAFVVLFWTAFEQSANVMIAWADKHTNLQPFNMQPAPVTVDGATAASAPAAASGISGWQIGPEQTQSFNSFFIIACAPLIAMLWTWLDRRGLQPSTPAKMAMGIGLVAVAFVVMLGAAVWENGKTQTPLAHLPDSVQLSKYGDTRLTYDKDAGQLHMSGVLPNLDRLKMLADTASPALVKEVDGLAKRSLDEKPPIQAQIESAPSTLQLVGDEATKTFDWDPATHTLTAKERVGERAELELFATAADPEFKSAIDKIYVASNKNRVTIWWLVGFFLMLTLGELFLSPVGLSLVTKIAPTRYVGLFMGGWFLSSAAAEFLAHAVFGERWGTMTPWTYFAMFAVIAGVGALLMAMFVPAMKRKMHGVH